MIIIKILLLIILYALLPVLGLILILILSPIKGRGNFKNGLAKFRGSYLFGAITIYFSRNKKNNDFVIKLFGFKIKTSKDASSKKSDKKDTIKKDTKEKKKKKYGLPNMEVIVLSLELIRKLIRKIAPNEMTLHLIVGLDDPYYTAILQMSSQVVFTPLNRVDGYNFSITPEYLDWAFEYDGNVNFNFSIMGLIIPILFFVFKKPIRDYLNILQFKKRTLKIKEA